MLLVFVIAMEISMVIYQKYSFKFYSKKKIKIKPEPNLYIKLI